MSTTLFALVILISISIGTGFHPLCEYNGVYYQQGQIIEDLYPACAYLVCGYINKFLEPHPIDSPAYIIFEENYNPSCHCRLSQLLHRCVFVQASFNSSTNNSTGLSTSNNSSNATVANNLPDDPEADTPSNSTTTAAATPSVNASNINATYLGIRIGKHSMKSSILPIHLNLPFCTFNGQSYMVNEVIQEMPERCLRLICLFKRDGYKPGFLKYIEPPVSRPIIKNFPYNPNPGRNDPRETFIEVQVIMGCRCVPNVLPFDLDSDALEALSSSGPVPSPVNSTSATGDLSFGAIGPIDSAMIIDLSEAKDCQAVDSHLYIN